MRAVKTIILANQREFTPIIDSCLTPNEFEAYCQEDYEHESISFFWGGDEKLVITTFPLNPEFIKNSCQIMNYKAVRTLSPSQHGDYLCNDIQNDAVLFNELVQTIRESENPQILIWGASQAYYDLVRRLESMGLSFQHAEVPPEEAAWTLEYFGSKAGFHHFGEELAKKHPQIKIPEGIICKNIDEALEKASYFAKNDRPFLMKSNLGMSGREIIIFNPASTLNNLTELQKTKIHSSFWKTGPVVLEEYIESGFIPSPDRDDWPLIPTVDMLITPSGDVQFQFIGNMLIENRTDYHGVVLGMEALPPQVYKILKEIGLVIGTVLSERGYRGWFDIDLVANAQQELYCTEINTRRTGPLHAFDIYTRLKAQHPEINATLSNDCWVVNAFAGYTYHQIKTALQEVLYPINGQPRGMILTLVANQGRLGFAIVGQNFADVTRIKLQAEALVG